jgi:hypothetical protein
VRTRLIGEERMKKLSTIVELREHFYVRDADLGHLPYRTKIEKDEVTGEHILLMSKSAYGDYAEIDDVMSFKRASKRRLRMKNLSCKQLKWSAFNRELTSIIRQLQSDKHPLNRVMVELDGQYYLLKQRQYRGSV